MVLKSSRGEGVKARFLGIGTDPRKALPFFLMLCGATRHAGAHVHVVVVVMYLYVLCHLGISDVERRACIFWTMRENFPDFEICFYHVRAPLRIGKSSIHPLYFVPLLPRLPRHDRFLFNKYHGKSAPNKHILRLFREQKLLDVGEVRARLSQLLFYELGDVKYCYNGVAMMNSLLPCLRIAFSKKYSLSNPERLFMPPDPPPDTHVHTSFFAALTTTLLLCIHHG